MINQFKQILTIEYGRMLPCLVAVIPSAPDKTIAGQCVMQIIKLTAKTFLSAENIEIVESDQIGYHLPAPLP